MEVVKNLKYIGRTLEQTDNDCLAVRRNIKQAWRVWGELGNMLRMKGVNPKVTTVFYRPEKQAVILFGLDIWVLLTAMEIMVEGNNIGFLIQITGKRARRKANRMWYIPAAEEVREAVLNQLDATYIGRIQGTVAQWVALWKIFEVCARETGYEGAGQKRDTCWHQEAPDTQLRATLEEI